MHRPLAPVLAALAAATLGCSRPPAPAASGEAPPTAIENADKEAPLDESTCVERLELGPEGSVLSEQRSLGKGADDFAARYAAADIDPDVQVPIEATRAYQIGKTPLLWFDADRTAVVVNAAVLSDLEVADVTQMSPGARAEVGRLSELGVGHIDGRALVKFLLAARAIATYVHIGSELCLVDERTDDAGYRARFTGSHTYFTSRKHTVPLRFDVQVDPAGVITVSVPAS